MSISKAFVLYPFIFGMENFFIIPLWISTKFLWEKHAHKKQYFISRNFVTNSFLGFLKAFQFSIVLFVINIPDSASVHYCFPKIFGNKWAIIPSNRIILYWCRIIKHTSHFIIENFNVFHSARYFYLVILLDPLYFSKDQICLSLSKLLFNCSHNHGEEFR